MALRSCAFQALIQPAANRRASSSEIIGTLSRSWLDQTEDDEPRLNRELVGLVGLALPQGCGRVRLPELLDQEAGSGKLRTSRLERLTPVGDLPTRAPRLGDLLDGEVAPAPSEPVPGRMVRRHHQPPPGPEHPGDLAARIPGR